MPQRVPLEAKIIGVNLRRLRKSVPLSQAQMGKMLGVTFQQIQKYEMGRNRFPVEKLFILKHAMNVPYEAFFDGMAINDTKERISCTPSPVWEKIDDITDMHLKRKIEKMLEIMLS